MPNMIKELGDKVAHSRFLKPVKTMFFGVVLVIAGGLFWYLLGGNPLDELALIRRAQTVPGFIFKAWEDVEDGERGQAMWFHTTIYEYRTPEGCKYQGKESGSGRLRDDLCELQRPYPIEVEYLPESPTTSRIRGSGCSSVMEWVWRKVAVGGFLLALFASGGIVQLREGVRELMAIRKSIRADRISH
jgi:hypothetical protein